MDKGRPVNPINEARSRLRNVGDLLGAIPPGARKSLLGFDLTKFGPVLAAGQKLLASVLGPERIDDVAAIGRTIAAAKELALAYAGLTEDPADDEWVKGILAWLTPDLEALLAQVVSWILAGNDPAAIDAAPCVVNAAGAIDRESLGTLLNLAIDFATFLLGMPVTK